MTTSSKPMMRADAASSPARISATLAFSSSGRQPVERLAGLAQRRVLQVALLAAGAAHEHGVHALGVVAGDGRRALRRLVVGVGVDGEQRQSPSSARRQSPDRRYPRRVAASRVTYAPPPCPPPRARRPARCAVLARRAGGLRHRRRQGAARADERAARRDDARRRRRRRSDARPACRPTPSPTHDDAGAVDRRSPRRSPCSCRGRPAAPSTSASRATARTARRC